MHAHTLTVDSSLWPSRNGHHGKYLCCCKIEHTLLHYRGLFVCILKNNLLSFCSLAGRISVEAPYLLHALPRQAAFEFLSESQTLWITYCLAVISHKQIGLTARLAVSPNF